MSKYSKIAPKDIGKLKEFLGSLYDYISDGDDVLDFGCSTGYFGELLINSKGCKVNGVEIDLEDLAKARKVLGKVYSFDLDGDWPQEVYEKKYDALFFGDVIEHLKYPEETVKKCKGLLKAGGKILISTPNIAHISTRLELLAGDFNYESTGTLDNTHLRLFTIDSLKKLAADTGYKILDVDYSLVDFAPTIIRSLLAKLGLTASDKFWKMVNSPEARAYQYKLVIQPLAPGEKARHPKLSDKPVSEHDKVFLDMKEVIDNNDGKVQALEASLEQAQHQSDEANARVDAIYGSKSWKLVRVLRAPRTVLNKLSRRKT